MKNKQEYKNGRIYPLITFVFIMFLGFSWMLSRSSSLYQIGIGVIGLTFNSVWLMFLIPKFIREIKK